MHFLNVCIHNFDKVSKINIFIPEYVEIKT